MVADVQMLQQANRVGGRCSVGRCERRRTGEACEEITLLFAGPTRRCHACGEQVRIGIANLRDEPADRRLRRRRHPARDDAHEVGRGVEDGRADAEPLRPHRLHEIRRSSRGAKLGVALDREGEPVGRRCGCRHQDVVKEPAIGSRLEVEADRLSEVRPEDALTGQNAGKQPRADVVLENEATASGVLRRRYAGDQDAPRTISIDHPLCCLSQ
ncbi:MAG: hypothetical protein ACLP1X_13300 [Polyangiaceae bacterium]